MPEVFSKYVASAKRGFWTTHTAGTQLVKCDLLIFISICRHGRQKVVLLRFCDLWKLADCPNELDHLIAIGMENPKPPDGIAHQVLAGLGAAVTRPVRSVRIGWQSSGVSNAPLGDPQCEHEQTKCRLARRIAGVRLVLIDQPS